MSTTTTRRPTSVTLLGVLILVAAALQVVGGIWLAVAAGQDRPFQGTIIEDWSDGRLWGGSIGLFVTAVIYVVLAFGVLRGNRVARIVVTVVAVLNIIGGIFTWPIGLAAVLVNVLVLVMLWHRTADDYFLASR
jgi:hypothetical protein